MRQKLMRKTFFAEEDFRQHRGVLLECLAQAMVARTEGASLSENEVTMLEIAVNEAVNNAFRYARDRVASPAVTLSMYVLRERFLLIRVKDNGSGFRADQLMTKVCSLEEEKEWEWGESGRGIFIMEAVMDKVRYNAKGNSVVLLKNLS